MTRTPGCGAGWPGGFEEDGSLSGTFRLPPLQGAVLLKALRAACADLAERWPAAGVSAETPAAGTSRRRGRPGGPDVLGPG